MTKTEERFLNAYRLAFQNKNISEESENMNTALLRQVFAMADNHCVFPMVFNTIYSSLSDSQKEEKIILNGKKKAEKLTCGQAMMTAEFLRLYQYLERMDFHPIVMKGIICRSLYPEPEQRSSSDEDLLIPEDLFEKYHKALTEYGLKIALPGNDIRKAHEVSYYNDRVYIELHKQPFPPDSKAYGNLNVFFTDVEQRKINQTIYGVTLYTMGHTDHLFYQICHAYKHFLNCGIGIRLVSDIILYSLTNKDFIDWNTVINNCRQIHAYEFAAALYRIGEKHLFPERFPEELKQIWETDKIDEEALLHDILSGGLYGTSSENRLHSATLTLHAVEAEKEGRHTSAIKQALFPSFDSMRTRYPYLADKPYLLPYTWIHRIINYGKSGILDEHSKNSASEAVRIGNERIALMKQYSILRERQDKPGVLKRIYQWSHSSFLAPVLSPLYSLVSMTEYHILNMNWVMKGEKAPSDEDKKLVRGNVTFIVKSFERQNLVKGLCRNITHMYPGAQVIIADDSKKPLEIDIPKVKVIHLPFNSGLSAGLAAALKEVKTPYIVRLDDDELLTVRSRVHDELRFLMEHPQLDLIGFGHTTAIRLHSPEFNFKEYYKSSMKDALRPLKIPHKTKIDDTHIVLGKVANLYIARTDKIREVGFDPNIRMIDHHEFFWRAAGIITSAIAKDTVVFHRHNPYQRHYQSYRSDFRGDLEYIKNKREKMIQEAKKENEESS